MPAADPPGSRPRDPPLPARPPWRRRLSSLRVVVQEGSMAPSLLPGDRLLVDRGAYAHAAPAEGEIVLVSDPERPGRLLVKRVGAAPGPLPAGMVWLRGDRADRSRDSRQFGPVPLSGLLGRVWFRYAPRDRRGPIGSTEAALAGPSR
ncbi:MAG: S26 family signal peptidase [Thermoplasmata archaeon]